MKIAIVGGGAAGMTTAHLLDKVHEVTVYEKQPILGGNIRTINKNVTCEGLDPNITLENGVIEFERDHFPNFHKLMHHLQVPIEEVPLSSELFLANGHHYKSAAAIHNGYSMKWKRLIESLKLTPVVLSYLVFVIQIMFANQHSIRHRPVSDYLGNSISDKWLKMMLMYAYSMPYKTIADFPAEIAVPLLRHSGMLTKWVRIIGGVYSYIEKIVLQFQGSIYCNTSISGISRDSTGVEIQLADGTLHHFDKVVFATTPDQVLALLTDPTDNEIRRFNAWKANVIDTVIHTDTSIYKHFGVTYFGEFDLFENKLNSDCGYNAYLDRLCGINAEADTHFSLAYNLNQYIDPDKIIDLQQHHSPGYNVEAIRYRQEVLESNGENNTYHTGAYLYEGLHEGAITSAIAVSTLLGGLHL